MIRRAPALTILAAVVLMLSASLSLALARSAPQSLLTPTARPIFDRAVYMPRLMRDGTPAPTATATSIAQSTATAQATATAAGSPTASATATASPTATSTPGVGGCVDYVYPLTLNKLYLQANPPAWYQPVTLASIGLSADAEDSQIPSLNSGTPFGTLNGANPNSPRFRIYLNPNTIGMPANYSWARWNGQDQQGSQQQLTAALTGAGSLSQGFSERTPPPEDPAAIPLLNGVLETGDWLAAYSGNITTIDLVAALNAHIANKTRMILPVHSLITGQGNTNFSGYKVDRFVEVRLLRYDLSPNGWFELALVQDNKTCGATPPTATVSTTATTAPTSTATSTAAPTATSTAAPTATSTATATPTGSPTASATATATSTAEPTSTQSPTATSTATATAPPTATATTPPTATATQVSGGSYPLSLSVNEQLQWYSPAQPGGSYDLVIVQDYSYSMRFCWDTNLVCADGSRRIDKAAGVLRSFVNEMLVVRNQQGGENRLAYVTFSQGATQRVPFMNDTQAALAAFRTQIGDQSSPRIIPNAELNGNTNIAGGLVGGVSYLNGARTVDSHGQPVRLAVLLLTDGIANVFNDGGMQNVSNKHTQAPFYCGNGPEDMDNPLVQFTCPSNEEFPNINPKPLPPVKAMVKASTDARAAKPIMFYAVVLGAQFGLTPVDMHLHEVAPDNYYMANNPAELDALLNAIAQELGEPCTEYMAAPRVAAGATVTIAHQGGGAVGTFTTNADGALVIPNMAPGAYTLSIQHLGVVAPQDPVMIPRNYTRILIGDNPSPQSSITFTMPTSAFSLPGANLFIDDPANAICPN